MALASDEVVARIYSTKLMRDYSNWVDYLYAHPPIFSHLPPGCATCGGGGDPGGRTLAVGPDSVLALARARGVDPYAKMRRELDIPASVQLPR